MKLKYFAAVSLLLISLGGTASAQRSKTDSLVQFNPHWYLHLEDGVNYSTGQHTFLEVLSPSVEFGAGYNFTPLFGVRAMLGWHQSRGFLPKDRYPDMDKSKSYAYQQVQLFADATLNLSNLIGGYRHDRVCDIYPYIGLGVLVGVENQHTKDQAVLNQLDCAWNPGKPFFGGRAGVFASFILTEHLCITADFYGQSTNDKLNSRTERSLDSQLNLLVGLTYRLTSKVKPYAYASASAAEDAALATVAAYNARNELLSDRNKIQDEVAQTLLYADSAIAAADSAVVSLDSTVISDVAVAEDNAKEIVARLRAKNEKMLQASRMLDEAIENSDRTARAAAHAAATENVSKEAAESATAAATGAAVASADATKAYAAAVAETKAQVAAARKASDNLLLETAKARVAAANLNVFSRDIFFALDKHNLDERAVSTANEIVAWYQAHPETEFILTGHASKEGPHGHNMALSKNRARSVKKFLTKAGVPASALKTDHKGDTEDVFPIFELNRCVTCRIIEK